jgi:hypothetical protein
LSVKFNQIVRDTQKMAGTAGCEEKGLPSPIRDLPNRQPRKSADYQAKSSRDTSPSMTARAYTDLNCR